MFLGQRGRLTLAAVRYRQTETSDDVKGVTHGCWMLRFPGAGVPRLVGPTATLPGRATPLPVNGRHFVHGRPTVPPWPDGHQTAVVGMGCFWGAERILWRLEGVHTTFVGYAGGHTPNPTYREVCSGMTDHAEVAVAIFDPAVIPYERILAEFWEQHDPTTPMRQGNDVGTQYRSILLVSDEEQRAVAERSLARYQSALDAVGAGRITTTIEPLDVVHMAEDEHQQYLAKNPGGYCNHGFCQAAYTAGEPR
jgi:peptide-methionine (S)-S-oxide reductase